MSLPRKVENKATGEAAHVLSRLEDHYIVELISEGYGAQHTGTKRFWRIDEVAEIPDSVQLSY